MLSNLLEIDERIFQTLADGGHSAQSGSLELLALEQTLAIFEEAHIIAGNGLNERLGGVKLAEGDTEMTVSLFSILIL
jgi:hypothetical protein